MAMNGPTLGTELKAALDGLSDSDKGDRDKVFEEMGKAIVSHIQSNAEITTSVSVTSVSGVTTGGGVSGPGSGSGTGTIS